MFQKTSMTQNTPTTGELQAPSFTEAMYKARIESLERRIKDHKSYVCSLLDIINIYKMMLEFRYEKDVPEETDKHELMRRYHI